MISEADREPAQRDASLWRLIMAQGHVPRAALLAALSLLTALSEGLGLALFAPLLKALAGERGGPALGILLLALTVLVAVRAALGHWRQLTSVRLRGEVVDGLRARAWDALLHAEWRALRSTRQTDSASLLISDIERFGSALSDLFSALGTAATLLAVLAVAAFIAPLPLMVMGGLGLFVAGLLWRHQPHSAALGEAISAAYRDIHAASDEALTGLRSIKSLAGEERAASRIAGAFRDLRRAEWAYWRVQGGGQIALQAGGAAALALAVWLAATRFGAGPAVLIPLVAVFLRALPLVGALHGARLHWRHARPALDAVGALQMRFLGQREPAGAGLAAPCLRGSIALADVSIRFAGAQIVDRITLDLPAGSITALVGPSGAGKSTVADVLGGLLEPDGGALLVDGTALSAPARRAWRSRVGYVAQDALLFPGTVGENLRLARPAADRVMLESALRRAAADFVFDLPGGLDCEVGAGGRLLSGGERQRLALAQALLREPALLILDEATSAIDPDSEALVARAVAQLRGSVTVVIIAHHGGLAAVADRVVRMERGRLVP